MTHQLNSPSARKDHRLRLWLWAAMTATVCTGCHRDPERCAVQGTVTLDGEPINEARIIFTPQSAGLAAVGSIVEGRFELSEDVGPTAGEFYVRISPNEAEMESKLRPGSNSQSQKRKIPTAYQANGVLTASITPVKDLELKFDLLSKPRQ